MLFFPIFWMLYDQQSSVWILQATRLDLHGLEPEQLNVLNPLEIMVFIPLFDIQIYPRLERRGFNIQPLRRMEYGMFLAAVSFLTSAWLEHYIQTQPSLSVSVALQIPQITILTVAEILLNVTGLEFAYSQAPSNMQALILALYLFMTAIGDGFAAVLYASVFSYLSSVVVMLLCALFMLVNLAFFSLVASRWKPYYRQSIDTNEKGLELRPIHLSA
jgi:POT family proton-dependent oligopeptide transporter